MAKNTNNKQTEGKETVEFFKDLDKEAVRLVNSMDCWSVGVNNGKPVRVAMTVDVQF